MSKQYNCADKEMHRPKIRIPDDAHIYITNSFSLSIDKALVMGSQSKRK